MAQLENGVIVAQQHTNCFQYRRKHEKQLKSLLSGLFSIKACGLTMASLLYSTHMIDFFYQSQSLFFGGTILGAIAASISLKVLRKVIHYYLSAILMIISGILFISVNNDSFIVIKVGSFLSGLAFGISLLTMIIHSGEISVKRLRGSLISNIQVGLDISLFIGILIMTVVPIKSNPLNSTINGNLFESANKGLRIIGIIKLIYGIIALLAAFFFVYESPIFLLENNNEQQAIKNLTILRKEPNSMTNKIHNEVEYIETTLKNKSIFIPGEIIPFLKIFACRFAYTLGTSVPVNVYLITYYGIYLGSYEIHTLYIGRFAAGLIPLWLIDGFLGRKLITVISFLGSGIFLIIIQAMASSAGSNFIINYDTFKTVGLLTVFYYIFIGFGANAATHTYMSEIFNHSSKTYINAIIIILENLIHLIIINFNFSISSLTGAHHLILFAGSMQILVGALAYGVLPETKGTTLLEAEEKAKKLITLKN